MFHSLLVQVCINIHLKIKKLVKIISKAFRMPIKSTMSMSNNKLENILNRFYIVIVKIFQVTSCYHRSLSILFQLSACLYNLRYENFFTGDFFFLYDSTYSIFDRVEEILSMKIKLISAVVVLCYIAEGRRREAFVINLGMTLMELVV